MTHGVYPGKWCPSNRLSGALLDSCEVIAERRDMEKLDVWFESSHTIARNPCCSVTETQTNVFKRVVFEGIANQSHFVMMIMVVVSVYCTIVMVVMMVSGHPL